MKYTTTFKKAVLRKVLPPENRSVHSVSKKMGVGEITIHRWISSRQKNTKILSRIVSSMNVPSGAATSQFAIDLNVSKSWGLSFSLGTEPFRLCSNHMFFGGKLSKLRKIKLPNKKLIYKQFVDRNTLFLYILYEFLFFTRLLRNSSFRMDMKS